VNLMRARATTVLLLGLLLTAASLAMAAPAAGQEDGEPPPVVPEPSPPGQDPGTGECDIESQDACFDPEACAALGVLCPDVGSGQPPDHERGPVTCTSDEGRNGAAVVICAVPGQDPPASTADTRITRVINVACDAVPPPPAWATAGLPRQTAHANPQGTEPVGWGLSGLDTWLWATGEQAYFWYRTGFGQAGRDVYAQDALYDADGNLVGWGSEYLLARQRWACMAQSQFSARIVAWHWTLDGPDLLEATGDKPGSQPGFAGDGREASVQLMPQRKGPYTLRLETTWAGDWPGAPTYRHTDDERPYAVWEIISEITERR
jgi:hypothetical protein